MSKQTRDFSGIVYGTWRIIQLNRPRPPVNDVVDLIDQCLSHGITTFDLADIYGNYGIESLFGMALKELGTDRDRVQLITKCGVCLVSDARPDHLLKHYDLSKRHIIRSVENSLRALRTDRVELLLLHRPDHLMDPDEIAEAFDDLAQSGKVLQFGVSNFSVSQMRMLNSRLSKPLSANQIEFSLLAHEALGNGVLDYLQETRALPMAWSPIAGGRILSGISERELGVQAELSRIAELHDATPDQIALAWIMHHPAGIVPVIGSTRTERIEQAAKSKGIKLSRQEWYSLLKASTGADVR